MPKFSKDKQDLMKTLSKLDNGVTVSDVTDLESAESKCSTLVLHVFLEALCALHERDEERRRRLFKGIIGFLSKANILEDEIMLSNLHYTRRKMAFKLLKVFNEVHKTIDPDATLDIQYLDFMQMDSTLQCRDYNHKFEEIKVIAEGGFGTVFMAKHEIDGLTYAVKKIIFKFSEAVYSKVIREVRSIATLNHINVVSYNSAWIEEDEEPLSDSSSSSDALSECGDSSICSISSRSSNKWNTSIESKSNRHVIKSKFFQSSNSSDVSQQSSRESDDSNVTKVGDIPLMNFKHPKVTLYIQMEYCDCDLRHWLDQRAKGEPLPFKMSEVAIFRDIVLGVAHIHSKSIIHRDLKPQNIFFSVKEGVMKIGDFGLATLEDFSSNNQQQGNISTELSSNLGTLPYAAPEQRNKHYYNTKVDIYSLGIILIELLLHFSTRMEFFQTIDDIARGQVPAEMISRWPNYVFLVKNLIHKDPNYRLSTNEILNLPVIQTQSNSKKCESARLLERLEQEVIQQRSQIAEQAQIILQLRKQIEELTCS